MTSMHHVTISAAYEAKSVRFYRHLGFLPAYRWASPTGELRIVHLKLGEVILEIFNYSDPQAAPETMRSLETDLPRLGIKHFGLKVPDIEEARKNVLALGLARDLEVKQGRTGIKYFFLNDPDGNWVEFVQDDRGL